MNRDLYQMSVDELRDEQIRTIGKLKEIRRLIRNKVKTNVPTSRIQWNCGGDAVVVDSDGNVCGGPYPIVYVGTFVVRIKDGRRFRVKDGWFLGETGCFPFPTLKPHP